jgi:hypothetical protein
VNNASGDCVVTDHKKEEIIVKDALNTVYAIVKFHHLEVADLTQTRC